MIYLDCNATTPLEPAVKDIVMYFLTEEFGNSGSRTHEFGMRAQRAVENARAQVAAVVASEVSEVVFTSGATESNNIAILGLAQFGAETGKLHIVSTSIEHKAVLEPLHQLREQGFEVTIVDPDRNGIVSADRICANVREDTLLVSVMHVNNETGAIQPIGEISEQLKGRSAFFHVDAAQGFGKEIPTLKNPRIDLISISGHKIYAPKGVGALIARRRGYNRLPIRPLMFGGGQERGPRPGTLPVHLLAGLGLASELAAKNWQKRITHCEEFKQHLLTELLPLNPRINGVAESTMPNAINLSFPGIDSEALMVALKSNMAISNGSACTSHSYQPSHVLKAMGLKEDEIKGAIRISWCHMSEHPDWTQVKLLIQSYFD